MGLATSGGDRYVVNIHTEVDVLEADGAAAHAECDDCGGEIDYNYAQGLLEQYDPGDR